MDQIRISLVVALLFTSSDAVRICNKFCDGDAGSNQVANSRVAFSVDLFFRKISIFVSDSENVAFAKIENGDPNDEVWIDRSWNGGRSWEDGVRIGNIAIPSGSREVTTNLFNIDGSFSERQIGVLRACGKAGERDDIACTAWTRSAAHSGNPTEAAATGLMMDYNGNGQWDTTGWWNAANCLTTIIDYMKVTNDRTFIYAIDTTFEKNKNQFEGNFCNDYLDDTAWWGLAWVGAFDLTGDQKYLDTAKITADFMYTFTDDRCGGGVYWSNARKYKNAITNELFIKLAAAIHNRIQGDTKYLNWAVEVWQWFDKSGMINNQNLINDGLNDNCQNNGDVTWTYNQGVILGGFVELFKATGDRGYLDRARKIADAAVASSYLNPNGILHEPCDNNGNDCGGDGPSFKGVFGRNMGELNAALDDKPYTEYLRNNANKIYENRNTIGQYGLHYEGPFQFHSAASQHSALDMLTAARRFQ